MALRKALIGAAFLAGTSSVALAGEPYTSPYDGAFNSAYLGLRGSIIDGADTHTTASGVDMRAHYGTGVGGSVYVGTPLAYGFRLEGEVKYDHFTLESLYLAGIPQAGRHGYQQIVAPMANLYWDAPLPDIIVRPFVGVGLGGAYIDTHDSIGTAPVLSTDNWHFAWQLMGGVALPLSQTSRLTGMYRYFRVEDVSYHCTPPALPAALCKTSAIDQSFDLGLEFDI
jgi:opacity protein-like surface antigen